MTTDACTETAKQVQLHLKTLLPKEAFSPDPTKLLYALGHLGVIVAGYLAIRAVATPWLWLALALVIAHSHLVLGFIAHDLSHGSVMRGKRLRYLVEAVLWAISGTSATMWRRTHNRMHHRHTNTPHDTFRYYARSEETRRSRLYSLLFIPNRQARWNPLVFVTYMNLMGGHTISAITEGKPGTITNFGRYSAGERLFVLLEGLGIVLYQVAVFFLVGGVWAKYLVAGPLVIFIGSAMASAYLYTQHSLHPLTKVHDPLHSTSLVLPRVIDWLHVNHSHHTAHHLFEGVNSDYYPLVTQLLQEHYPERFQRLRPWECWRRIQQNPLFKEDPA